MNDWSIWLLGVAVVVFMTCVFGAAAGGLAIRDMLRVRWQRRFGSCSFCGRGTRAVERLIAGPRVMICDQCTRVCGDRLNEHLRGVHAHGPEIGAAASACSFCGRGLGEVRLLMPSSNASICDACVGVCQGILAADAASSGNVSV
jgi:hypothetical protein